MPTMSSRWSAIFAIVPKERQRSSGGGVQLSALWHWRFVSNPEQIRPEMLLQLNPPPRESREIVEAIHDVVAHQQEVAAGKFLDVITKFTQRTEVRLVRKLGAEICRPGDVRELSF